MSFVGLLGPLSATQTGFGGPQFSNFMPQQTGLSQQDEQELMRMGMLQAGLSILANNDGRSFGQAVGAGLLGGLNAYQQGKARKKGELLGASENARRDYRTMIADMYQQEQARREQERFGMQQQQFGWQQQQQQREQERQDATQKALASITATPGTPQWAQQMALAAQAQGDVQAAARFGGMAAPDAAPQESWLQPQAVMTSDGRPVLVQMSNRGNQKILNDFAPTPKAVRTTDDQNNASKFAMLMEQSEKDFSKSGNKAPGFIENSLAGTSIGNALIDSELQTNRAAQENWVRANLRKESGAAIGVDEMDKEIRRYFPQPGDNQETISNKATYREIALRAMRQQAGPALQGGASTGQGQQNNQWRVVR